MSPDEVIGRANTMVVLTNDAPRELLALAGPSRKAILLNFKPLMITFPDQKGVYKVQPDDIVFENHHTGRDVTEAGSQETSYEKFFASAMKKFGVSSPIDLSPEDTKKFFNYVDKNWDAEEESDGSKTEILPALARGAMAVGNVVGALGDENESGWEDPPRLGGEPSLITPMESDDNEDVSTGKVGKKDKGSYQHAYKLALKKYQIHSADELDTPAERKGFTAYVDKLWKGGEVKDHALESEMNEKRRKPKKKNRNKNKKNKTNPDQAQRDRERDQQQAEREREAEEREREGAEKAREREQERQQDEKEREREAERRERDRERGQKQREDEKKDRDKKKSGGLGIGSALKDLGRYTISKAQSGEK
jgi:hypothetical protein